MSLEVRVKGRPLVISGVRITLTVGSVCMGRKEIAELRRGYYESNLEWD